MSISTLGVRIGEKYAHAEAKNITSAAVFLRGLLRAVVERTLARKVDSFSIRSKELDFGDIEAGFWHGQVAAVRLQELSRLFVVPLSLSAPNLPDAPRGAAIPLSGIQHAESPWHLSLQSDIGVLIVDGLLHPAAALNVK